jgi:hypothetical protein
VSKAPEFGPLVDVHDPGRREVVEERAAGGRVGADVFGVDGIPQRSNQLARRCGTGPRQALTVWQEIVAVGLV